MIYTFCLGPQQKKARYEVPQKRPASHTSPVKPSPSTSKFYPKSLSIKDILRLGRVVDNKAKKILIYKFDFVHMEIVAYFTNRPGKNIDVSIASFKKCSQSRVYIKNNVFCFSCSDNL